MPEATLGPATTPPAVKPAGRRTASIAGIGTALPRRAVSNEEIARRLDVDADWIEHRTGIRERRHASGEETLLSLATEAATKAIAAAGVEAADLDLVLFATFTPDELLPNAAPLLAGELGVSGAFACDLGAACTGFLSGLALASAQIESGRSSTALVVGADLVSRVTDPSDRKTAGLFADGAGAGVISAGGAGSIDGILLRSDAAGADCIRASNSERLVRMRGQDTFRAAVDALSEVTGEILAAEGIGAGDVDLFVYHQANARITQAVGERLALPAERVVDCIGRLGNTSAATLPLALAHAHRDGMLSHGDRVLVAAFGAGFVWGGGLLSWEGEIAS